MSYSHKGKLVILDSIKSGLKNTIILLDVGEGDEVQGNNNNISGH